MIPLLLQGIFTGLNGVCKSQKKILYAQQRTTLFYSFFFSLNNFLLFCTTLTIMQKYMSRALQFLYFFFFVQKNKKERDYSLEQHFSSHKWHHKLGVIHEAKKNNNRAICRQNVLVRVLFAYFWISRMWFLVIKKDSCVESVSEV